MTTQLHSFKSLLTTIMLLSFASFVEAATITSTTTGGNWSSTTTWVGGAVPGSGDDVIIASSVAGTTVTVDVNNAACASLTINMATNNQTGIISFSNGTSILTVSGAIIIGGTGNRHGTIDMTNGGTLKAGGTVTLNNGGVFTAGTGTVEYTSANPTIASLTYQNLTFSGTGTAGAGGALTIRGNLLNTGGGTLSFGANNVILSGTTSGNIAGFTTTGIVSMTKTAGTATFTGNVNGGGLTINGAGGTLDLGAGLVHTFTGAWTRTAGTLIGNTSLLKIGGSVAGAGGTFTAGTGTVEWNGAGAQTLAGVSYFNLTLSGGGVKTLSAGTTVNGTLSLQGTATTLGASPTFGATSTLEYKGSSAQTSTNVEFPAANGPFNLIINNSSGVTLNAPRTINGAVTFTSGILNTTATNLLTFNNGATTPSSTNTSFVNGPVRKVFNAAESFTFPIGVTGTGDEPLGISGATALNDDFTAQYLRSSATSLGGTISPILNVSRCDQWTLTKNSAPAANVSLTLSWDANSSCNAFNFVTDPSTLTIGHFNGSAWDQAGTSGGFTGTATAGTVIRNNVTAFSPFSLANTTQNQNPLPLTFGNIKGYAKNGGIQIDWSIYNEYNVDHYEIERSLNGMPPFTTLGQTAARNTDSKSDYEWVDATPSNGNNFYRIKSVDINGKISYSTIVRLNLNQSGKGILVYPNPATKGYISFQSSDLQKGSYTLKIINSNGQAVYKQEFVHEGGAFSQTISLPAGIKSGMYNLQLRNGNEVTNKTFVVQ